MLFINFKNIDFLKLTQYKRLKKKFNKMNLFFNIYPKYEYFLNIQFVVNKNILFLNEKYKKKKIHTDVLTFSTDNVFEKKNFFQIFRGDVIISLDIMQNQAETFRHTLENEIIIVLLHSICHLNKIDHTNNFVEFFFQVACEMSMLYLLNLKPKKSLCNIYNLTILQSDSIISKFTINVFRTYH